VTGVRELRQPVRSHNKERKPTVARGVEYSERNAHGGRPPEAVVWCRAATGRRAGRGEAGHTITLHLSSAALATPDVCACAALPPQPPSTHFSSSPHLCEAY